MPHFCGLLSLVCICSWGLRPESGQAMLLPELWPRSATTTASRLAPAGAEQCCAVQIQEVQRCAHCAESADLAQCACFFISCVCTAQPQLLPPRQRSRLCMQVRARRPPVQPQPGAHWQQLGLDSAAQERLGHGITPGLLSTCQAGQVWAGTSCCLLSALTSSCCCQLTRSHSCTCCMHGLQCTAPAAG